MIFFEATAFRKDKCKGWWEYMRSFETTALVMNERKVIVLKRCIAAGNLPTMRLYANQYCSYGGNIDFFFAIMNINYVEKTMLAHIYICNSFPIYVSYFDYWKYFFEYMRDLFNVNAQYIELLYCILLVFIFL